MTLTHSLFYLYLILLLPNIAQSCRWIISCELQVGKTARIADVVEKFLRPGGGGKEHRLDSGCGELESLVSVTQSLLSSVRILLIICYPTIQLNLQNILSNLSNGTLRLHLCFVEGAYVCRTSKHIT
jgi:hypothetical protein